MGVGEEEVVVEPGVVEPGVVEAAVVEEVASLEDDVVAVALALHNTVEDKMASN